MTWPRVSWTWWSWWILGWSSSKDMNSCGSWPVWRSCVYVCAISWATISCSGGPRKHSRSSSSSSWRCWYGCWIAGWSWRKRWRGLCCCCCWWGLQPLTQVPSPTTTSFSTTPPLSGSNPPSSEDVQSAVISARSQSVSRSRRDVVATCERLRGNTMELRSFGALISDGAFLEKDFVYSWTSTELLKTDSDLIFSSISRYKAILWPL